ncbi:hypothetical protein D3C85_1321400 [compost metagenome]
MDRLAEARILRTGLQQRRLGGPRGDAVEAHAGLTPRPHAAAHRHGQGILRGRIGQVAGLVASGHHSLADLRLIAVLEGHCQRIGLPVDSHRGGGGYHHHCRRLAATQQRQQAVEQFHGAKIVDRADQALRFHLRSQTGAQHHAVETTAQALMQRLQYLLAPLGTG